MVDAGTYVWLLISACTLVVGFFLGKRHGVRVERAANAVKESAKDLAGKL